MNQMIMIMKSGIVKKIVVMVCIHNSVADPEGDTGGTCAPSYFLIHYLIATTLTVNSSKPWPINYLTSYVSIYRSYLMHIE